ncbi:MAG: glycoside hydrolase family 9 protein [Cytophagaceae bacterium]|jgi:hypothetical protein|nr:glycoside hydrolase family 9 protein [Cytophagaceae bacterium]
MKTLLSIHLLLALSGWCVAQHGITNDTKLEKELVRTGLVHAPLKIDESRSAEVTGAAKKVVANMPLTVTENLDGWTHKGFGNMHYSADKTVSGHGSIRLAYPSFTGTRAQGSPNDPDYAVYGNAGITLNVKGANWEAYNRIAFYIYPDCEGARVVNINLSIANADTPDKEGYNRKNGSHLVNLENRKWNKCYLDIGEYQRDRVTSIAFGASLKGKDRTAGDSLIYYFDGLELQQVENPEVISGWTPTAHSIVYSTTGYVAEGSKTAIANVSGHNGVFQLVDATNGMVVYNGKVQHITTTTGAFDVLNFSDFKQAGSYRLKAGDVQTAPFAIADRIWDNSMWRVLNFIFCQRCGHPVQGKHAACHLDLHSKHNGRMISYAGGWHDAGDLSQQTLQTGDVAFALLESYNKLKDTNPLLAARMLEEAEWGIEFITRNRYGDGYRASSMGLLIWQDGELGTLDDITSVRVQNIGFDNFLYAAYEAYAALTIADADPAQHNYLTRIAKQDFAFAMDKHAKDGYGGFIHFYEHSYNTSESQYMATVSWAASMLYLLTGDAYYADKATEFIGYTLDCQRTKPIGTDGVKGFFYRDRQRKVIVHYNHQSREQVYMQAMALLCETQPQHPDRSRWEASIRLYGNYIKSIAQYTQPYGMISSGVYHINEPDDRESFQHSHLFTDGNEAQEYVKQLKLGVQLDEEHYLRRFPVGFGIFNGNNAVLLSMGKAAAICGNFLHDDELLRIGREQLYWVVGKNPFGLSMIYGEGYNYPRMDTFSSGEMTGEMPVGIRSLGNGDVPYFPPTNNATYKEVWVTTAGKWLTLLAEY